MRRALVLWMLAACGPASSSHEAPDGATSDAGTNVFAATTADVLVEVDYETGQEPYTGSVANFGDTWEPTLANLQRLFPRGKAITLPMTLADMQDIGPIDDEEITIYDLATIAATHRDHHDTPDTKTYYVVFVSGHYAVDVGVQAGVLGVSVGDTIVMFKDVIRSSALVGNPNTVRYVEQSTVVHELAHAIGLVDGGIPMVVDHKDAQHGNHCNNPDCVMYWQNEGAADARDFALRRVQTGSDILFDSACLIDIDAKTGGP